MRLVLDACVLYPSVMREVLIGAASLGHFRPVWSARILEEWRRAALRLGPVQGAQAEGEIALLRAAWPRAEQPVSEGIEARLWLPDGNDIHVLATAIASSSDGIVTMNAKDFPRHMLAEEGLLRLDPDGVLHGLWQKDPEGIGTLCDQVLARANAMGEGGWQMRSLLKKARLPRLAKAVSQSS